ncbi:PAS domain S-box protein [Methanolobus vulcani]|nr:PAS domain S-box protein [Methanolobus vulcani]
MLVFPLGTFLLGSLLKNQLSGKETQDALKENETMLRNFIDNVPVGMFRMSSERKIIQTNPEMAHILGLNTPEQAISYFRDMGEQIYVNPKDPVEIATTLQKQGYIKDFECEVLRAEGRHIWVLINARTSGDLKADSFIIDGFIHDITKSKLAELELEKSREQFMLAVNGSQDGIWDWNIRDNSLYLSTQCKEMFEYDGHIPTDVFSLIEEKIHPDDKLRVRGDLEKYLNGEIPGFNIEFRVIDRNGNNVWIQVRGAALRSENGTAYRMAGSITDITERKNAEIKIAEGTVRRRILIEQSSDGIVVLDKDGYVFEANLKFAEMLGYSPEEVLSLHQCDWDAKFTPDELNDMRSRIDEKGDHFETTHHRKDGTLFDVEISSNAAMFGEQKLIFCVCRDITERKQAEKELLRAKLEAESANRAKSQFIATMSHELRTPLTSVIGFSDILSTNASDKLTEKEQVYIDNINNSGKHLLDIINDILDLSLVDSGKIELECEKVFVKEVFDEILTIKTLKASKKNIDIRINNKIPFESIFADKVKFKQIMFNLLSNAIKFSHENSVISVIADKKDTTIEVSVSDTGIGIPKDRLKYIFDPFTQVDSSDTRKYGGTGLGLAIVKQLVELHKGTIWVESEEGKGSTFTFTLPIREFNE